MKIIIFCIVSFFIGFVVREVFSINENTSNQDKENKNQIEEKNKPDFWSDYGEYHKIKITTCDDSHKYRDPNLRYLVEINGQKLKEKKLIHIEYLGNKNLEFDVIVECSGFMFNEPVGSPIKDYPAESLERTELDYYYNSFPPRMTRSGRDFIMDRETIFFHYRKVFIVTSVISPAEARKKFEEDLISPK